MGSGAADISKTGNKSRLLKKYPFRHIQCFLSLSSPSKCFSAICEVSASEITCFSASSIFLLTWVIEMNCGCGLAKPGLGARAEVGGGRDQTPSRHCSRLGETQLSFWWLEDPHHSKRRRNTGHQPLEPGKTPTLKLDPTEKLDFFEPSDTHQEFSTSHIHQTLSAILPPQKNLKGKPNTSVKNVSGFSFNLKFPKFSSNATESERTPFSHLALTRAKSWR